MDLAGGKDGPEMKQTLKNQPLSDQKVVAMSSPAKTFVENATLTLDGERLRFNNTGRVPVAFMMKREHDNSGPMFQLFTEDIFGPAAPAFIHRKGALKGSTAWLSLSVIRKMAKAAGVSVEVF